jgi:hypothetical protein
VAQVLNDLLSALAEEEAELDAQSARAALQNSRPATRQQQQQQRRTQASAATPAAQAAQQRRQQQQQQQQTGVDSGELRAAAKQLGKVDPALAREWHDAQLRAALAQVRGAAAWVCVSACV